MRYAIVVSLMLLLVGGAYAAEQSGPNTISLQVNDVDIGEALAGLSQQAQVSILGDSTVKGKVTCNLKNLPLEQALDTLCKMNKLVWLKAYASVPAGGSPSASSLFKLFDALKELGGSALICEDPTTQSRTIFVPSAEPASVDASAVVSGLKLKAVYLVRAEPDPAAKEAEKAAQQRPSAPALLTPPADVTAAAQNVWNYFGQMPMDQQFQVMHELRHMMFQNLTPEQMQNMRNMFGDGRQRGDDRRHEDSPRPQ